jgi:hypothetical protein
MKHQWSYNRHILIKTSMYLKGMTIKALIKLKFNPGEGVAYLSSRDAQAQRQREFGNVRMLCW